MARRLSNPPISDTNSSDPSRTPSIPVSTSISCVPNMLDYGNRGILVEPDIEEAVLKITDAIKYKDLKRMSKLASEWSQNFTLDYFESEIKKLLVK